MLATAINELVLTNFSIYRDFKLPENELNNPKVLTYVYIALIEGLFDWIKFEQVNIGVVLPPAVTMKLNNYGIVFGLFSKISEESLKTLT